MESLKERVRAKPRFDAVWGSGFGVFSWALGAAQLLAPHAVLDWIGVDRRHAPLLRAFGMREVGTGVAILQNPVGPQFLWARVAGDLVDLAALALVAKGSRRPGRALFALGLVKAITLADVVMSARLTQLAASKRLARS